MSVSSDFHALPEKIKDEARERAREEGKVESFYDLDHKVRAQVYEQTLQRYFSGAS